MTSLRQAGRALVRRPVFTLAVVLTMTAGIGVTTASFSIVDRVLLRPLPFPDGDQLVSVYEASPSRRERLSLVAPARLGDWNRLNRTFDAISGSYSESVTDTSSAEPERLEGRRVMPRFFDVFAMPALVGRTFVDQEERFGGPAAAVISEPFWTRRFARNPAAIGQRLTIGGKGYTIVGVMPSAFTSGLGGTALRTAISIDLWIPAQIAPRLLEIREARFLGAVGRMRRGVTLDQARADLSRVQQQLGEQYPKTDKDWGAMLLDLKEARVGDYRRALLLIFGAVGLLLLIAIANVAGLMLVQLRRRAAELAIRSAIGASHRQVVMVIVREVAILVIAGADRRSAGGGLAHRSHRDGLFDSAHLGGDDRPARAGIRCGHQRAVRRAVRPAARDLHHATRPRAAAVVHRTRRLRRSSPASGGARCRANCAERRAGGSGRPAGP